jgi:hypothetical protein
MSASRRVPARLSPERSETRHLVSYYSKGARPGACGREGGRARSAALCRAPPRGKKGRGHNLSRSTRVVPRCPALSRVRFFLGICGTGVCTLPKVLAHGHQACTQQAGPAPNMKQERRAGRGVPVKVGRTRSHPVAPGQTKKKLKNGSGRDWFSRRTRRWRRKKGGCASVSTRALCRFVPLCAA